MPVLPLLDCTQPASIATEATKNAAGDISAYSDGERVRSPTTTCRTKCTSRRTKDSQRAFSHGVESFSPHFPAPAPLPHRPYIALTPVHVNPTPPLCRPVALKDHRPSLAPAPGSQSMPVFMGGEIRWETKETVWAIVCRGRCTASSSSSPRLRCSARSFRRQAPESLPPRS